MEFLQGLYQLEIAGKEGSELRKFGRKRAESSGGRRWGRGEKGKDRKSFFSFASSFCFLTRLSSLFFFFF